MKTPVMANLDSLDFICLIFFDIWDAEFVAFRISYIKDSPWKELLEIWAPGGYHESILLDTDKGHTLRIDDNDISLNFDDIKEGWEFVREWGLEVKVGNIDAEIESLEEKLEDAKKARAEIRAGMMKPKKPDLR